MDANLNRFYSTALRLTRDRTEAEDLVAEAAAKAWENIHTLVERGRFAAWFTRIMTNDFISGRRAAGNRYAHQSYTENSQDDEAFSLFEQLHQPFLLWWGNPEQQFLNQVLKADIEKALDSLPEPYRLMIVLADIQGLNYREIAEALSIPVGTVRSRLSRARARMQKRLWMHAAQVRDKTAAGEPENE